MTEWGRVLTAMVTPFDNSGEVDYTQAERLANHLLENGTDALVIAGTTGESPTLTTQEKLRMIETVKNAVGNKGAVIAGTGSYNTKESVELTQEASRLGIDGIMLVAPYYNKPTQEGIYRHFATIAESTELPVMIYNIPGRTSINVELSTLLRLTDIANVAAVKEASGNMSQIADTISQKPKGFKVYSGDDLLTLPILSMGGDGVVSVTSHIVGKDLARMVNAYFEGDVATAASLHRKMIPIVKAMFYASNPTPTKYALRRQGLNVGGVRLPLVELSDKEREYIDTALINYGLIAQVAVSIR